MRVFLALAAMVIAYVVAPSASAQAITSRDPRLYMETLANTMGVSGLAPLRSIYGELSNGGPINPTIEAALLTYERGIPSTQAVIAKVEEDITLSDTYRQIYLYHYWGQNYWMHTRVDFVRISADGEWAVSYIAFASEWGGLVAPTTPGFRSANRN